MPGREACMSPPGAEVAVTVSKEPCGGVAVSKADSRVACRLWTSDVRGGEGHECSCDWPQPCYPLSPPPGGGGRRRSRWWGKEEGNSSVSLRW